MVPWELIDVIMQFAGAYTEHPAKTPFLADLRLIGKHGNGIVVCEVLKELRMAKLHIRHELNARRLQWYYCTSVYL